MKMNALTKAQRDNRANQLNPNNEAYYKSRGYEKIHRNNQSGNKKIHLPEGTFRAFTKRLTLNSPRLGMDFSFLFDIDTNGPDDYYILVRNAPFLDFAHDHPHDFHIYSNNHICWDQEINNFRDANAIMLTWAKMYVRTLEALKYNVGCAGTGQAKRIHLPTGTFRMTY